MTPWELERRAVLNDMGDSQLIEYARKLFPPDMSQKFVLSRDEFKRPAHKSRSNLVELIITLERELANAGVPELAPEGSPALGEDEPADDDPGVEVHELMAGDGTFIRKVVSSSPYKTRSSEYIMNTIFPQWAKHFLAKNADYGDQHRYALGPRAEYVGIDRKMYKLEETIWHERDLNGEQAREILFDIIGQSFILIDLLDGNWEPRSRRDRRAS